MPRIWKLLEAYLDDALSPGEVQRLDARLSDEPLLSAAFDSLKSQRAACIAIFNADAPSEREAERFSAAFLSSIDRRQWNARFIRHLRVTVAVAACLLIGFAVGWMGRGHGSAMQAGVIHPEPASPAISPLNAHNDAHLVIHSPKAPEPGQYQVAVLDADGNVIALQRFAKLRRCPPICR